MILSPSTWLEAVVWNNGVNILDGSLTGIVYTLVPGAGTVTITADGSLLLTSPNPTNPGQVSLALGGGGVAGWVRFNGAVSNAARYELTEIYTGGATLGGIGQGSYTTLPAAGQPPAPTAPIAGNIASFSIAGGTLSQVTGNVVGSARVQNILFWQGSGYSNYTTISGATGDTGFNPFTVLQTPAAGGVTFWNASNQVNLLVYPVGGSPQSMTAEYMLVGTGAMTVQGSGVGSLSSVGANGYQLYRPITDGLITSGTLNLAAGEVVELQGSLQVSGTIGNLGGAGTPSTILLGGHGDPAAELLFTANATVAPSVVVQENPTRVFPLAVNTGVAGVIASPSFALVGGSQVLVGSGITLSPDNLYIRSGGSLTTATGSTLTVGSSSSISGTLTGATSQTLTLAALTATGANSTVTVPSGTVTTTTLGVDAGANLVVTASSGTVTASGLVSVSPASTSLSAGGLAINTNTIQWNAGATLGGNALLTAATATTISGGNTTVNAGATLAFNGDAPVTISALTGSATQTGNVAKTAGAGAVNIQSINVPANATINVSHSGSAVMTLGGSGGINLGGSLDLTGSGAIVIDDVTGNSGAALLSIGGSGARTFGGSLTVGTGNSLTLRAVAPDTLTVPATVPFSFAGAIGTLQLQGPLNFDPPLTLGAGPQTLGLLGGGTRVASVTSNGGTLGGSNADNFIASLILNANTGVTGTGSITLGAVSGAGTLSSTGTIILTGGSSVSAPSISANVLKLTGNPFLSPGVALVGNPTLEIAGNLNQNLGLVSISGNTISFTGDSILKGLGTLVATTTINALAPAYVTLEGINLKAGADLTIAAGARLGGIGQIEVGNSGAGLLKVEGILFAGDPVGTLTIKGPVTFDSTGIFDSQITPSGIGLLDVITGNSGAGVASLAGGLNVTLTGLKPPLGTTYTVLEADSVVGTFETTGGSAGILTFEAIYTPTEVQVVVVIPKGGLCSLAKPCSAAEAVACAFDDILAEKCYSPCFEDFIFNEIFYPSDSINFIWQQLAGGPYTDLPQLAGLQMMVSQDILRSQQWMMLDRWDCGAQNQAWLTPTGDEITSNTWRFRAAGAQVGYAHTWSTGFGLGLAGTIEAVNFRSKTFSVSGQGLNAVVSPVASYVPSWRSGNWRSYLLASGSIGGLVTEVTRNILWSDFCCEAHSHWNPIDLSGRLEGGLSYRDCTLALQPFAALSAFKVQAGSIRESSSCCVGLDVSCWQESFGLFETGFRWRDNLCAMNTTFAPEFDLGFYKLLWGRGSQMVAQFEEACCTSWSLCGPALSRWGAFGGFGLQASASDCLTIGARIDGRFAKEYTAWAATAQATWRF